MLINILIHVYDVIIYYFLFGKNMWRYNEKHHERTNIFFPLQVSFIVVILNQKDLVHIQQVLFHRTLSKWLFYGGISIVFLSLLISFIGSFLFVVLGFRNTSVCILDKTNMHLYSFKIILVGNSLIFFCFPKVSYWKTPPIFFLCRHCI